MNRTERAIARKQARQRDRDTIALLRRVNAGLSVQVAELQARRATIAPDKSIAGKGYVERKRGYDKPIRNTHVDTDAMADVFANAVNA
jgi:hypothetical protein